MFLDDVPEYPMTGFFRLRFSETLQVGALNAAIQTTLKRHPLVCSRVVRDSANRLCWERAATSTIALEMWSTELQGEFPAAGHVDLTQTTGTRIWLVDRNGAHDVVVQIHHACTDALGMCQLIDDLLICYARNVGDEKSTAELRSLNNQTLARRNHFGLSWRQLLQLLPHQIAGLLAIGRFFSRTASPLRLRSDEEPRVQAVTFPSVCGFEFCRHVTTRILSEARHRNVTVNDLIVHDVFLALDEWRTQHGTGGQNDWIRLFVPINERTADDESLSAANIMSAVFLERRPSQMASPQTLLQSIQAEMQTIKRGRLGLLFIAAQMLLRRIPRLRDLVIHRQACLSSCVFSNLGVILGRTPLSRQDGKIAIGDVLLDRVEFFAPLRPFTHLTICVFTYAGRLSVNLHFDPRAMSRHQAEHLQDSIVTRIHQSLRGDLPAENGRHRSAA